MLLISSYRKDDKPFAKLSSQSILFIVLLRMTWILSLNWSSERFIHLHVHFVIIITDQPNIYTRDKYPTFMFCLIHAKYTPTFPQWGSRSRLWKDRNGAKMFFFYDMRYLPYSNSLTRPQTSSGDENERIPYSKHHLLFRLKRFVLKIEY